MTATQVEKMIAELHAAQKETDRQMKETDARMKDTDCKIKDLGDLFTGQWGKLVEALVDSGLPELFRKRGIAVTAVSRRYEFLRDGRKATEVDVFLHDGGEDVAVEIKTTCRPADVDEHLERLATIRSLQPGYASGARKLYGAVAALRYEAGAEAYAKRKGFFVLEGREGLFTITNEEGFKPRAI